MKKTITKLIFNGFAIFALAMLLLSCPKEVQEEQGMANVSFSVADLAGRTVLPQQVDLEDVTSYQLLGSLSGGGEEIVLVESFSGRRTSTVVSPGTWNFTLNAYNETELILQGTVSNKLIQLTVANQVSFTMSPANSGRGDIQITLNFPPTAGITQVTTSGEINEHTFSTADSGTLVYIENGIDSGDYIVNFQLYCRDELRAVVSELVLVRSGLTSSKTINLTGENLKPLSEIAIELGSIDEWELTEQSALAAANVAKVFTANGTYAAYRWYLDGTLQAETSSSYIFNQAAGVYQLTVVATDGMGESRSGRCRVTVARSLAADVWENSSIAYTSGMYGDWYALSVVSGTTYYIWWNDRGQGNGSKTGDIAVGARYEDATAFLWGGTAAAIDSGWATPQSFTASQSGTVFIRVYPQNGNAASAGTYGIAYNTSGTRPAIYTVAFNANDGNGSVPAARSVNPGSSIVIPAGGSLTRPARVFSGWNTNSAGTGTALNPGASYTPTTANTTLYAQWIVDLTKYTITFDLNGGSGTTPAGREVDIGSAITLPSNSGLSRPGYSFGGWNTSQSGTGSNYGVNVSYTAMDNITLYARWYSTVTFDANGGSGSASREVNAGFSIIIPSGAALSITRTGYSVNGWKPDPSDTAIYRVGDSYTPTGHVTLYANWYPNYTVTFDGNRAAGSAPAAQTVSAGSSITLPSGGGFVNPGKTFSGWNTNTYGTGTNYDAGSLYTPTGNVTLYARWQYKITFDTNGAIGSVPPAQMVPVGSSITLPSEFGLTRTGYTFGGWNTSSSGSGTNYMAGSSYTPTGNSVLYARWVGGGSLFPPRTWVSGNLYYASSSVYFSFEVTYGSTYYIWWNDSMGGDGTQTARVAVGAQYSGLSGWIFGGSDTASINGWSIPRSFTATRSGTVVIKVQVYEGRSVNRGTFAIAYNTVEARP
jgi:uncharacterized repeat protein (TIGR02543 family)